MSAIPVLLGAPGLAGEPQLVTALNDLASPIRVTRRCVDAVDLLGAAAGGHAQVAVVGAGLPRLARETVARLEAAGLRVVGIVTSDDETGRRRLGDLGISVVILPLDDPAAAVSEMARAFAGPVETRQPCTRVVANPDVEAGRLVAVWGPTGAPGRTSIAIGLSDELARQGTPSLLVDADTYGGSISTHLGLVEETAGIVVAFRRADSGHLDVDTLAGTARTLAGSARRDGHGASVGLWRLITGIPRAERWAELRPSSLTRLWQACRETPGVTVADVGFSLEADEEFLADARAPRRNGATLSALAAADMVVAVGSADPIGMERLIVGLADLRRVTDQTPTVVINRVRRGPLGRDAEGQVREALRRHAGVTDPILVVDDRDAFDTCLREGGSLGEVVPRSAARAGIVDLARRLSRPAPLAVAA